MLDYRGTKYPLGIRNNNPGNLRPGHDWQGMIGEHKGFVVFSNIMFGLRALAMDLINKQLRGLDTVRKIINVYAPPTENNTKAYIAAVCKAIGVGSDEKLPLTKTVMIRLVAAVVDHENGPKAGSVISDSMIADALKMIPDKLRSRLK